MITVFKSSKIVSGPKLYVLLIYIQYSQRSLMTPFPHPLHTPPSSHHSPSPLHHFTTSPLHHFTTSPLHHFTTSPLHCNSHLTPPHTIPHSLYHHSPSPLLRPLQLTTPQTTPPPLPHTTKNSSLLPHTAPLSVAETRNNVAVMILL